MIPLGEGGVVEWLRSYASDHKTKTTDLSLYAHTDTQLL